MVELNYNAAKRDTCPIAFGRKNTLFVASEPDRNAAAIACTLIATAKVNGVDAPRSRHSLQRLLVDRVPHPQRPAAPPVRTVTATMLCFRSFE